jgi:hypothetical protein
MVSPLEMIMLCLRSTRAGVSKLTNDDEASSKSRHQCAW